MQKSARLFSQNLNRSTVARTTPKYRRAIILGTLGLSIASFAGFFYFKHQFATTVALPKANWVKEYAQSEIKPEEVKKQLDFTRDTPSTTSAPVVILEEPKNENTTVTIHVTNNAEIDEKEKHISSLKSEIQKNLGTIVELNKKIQEAHVSLDISNKKTSELTSQIVSSNVALEKMSIERDNLVTKTNKQKLEYESELTKLNHKVSNMIEEAKQNLDMELKAQQARLDKNYDEKNFDRAQKLAEALSKLYASQNLLIRNLQFIDRSMDLHKLTMSILSLQDTLQTNGPFLPEIIELSNLLENDELGRVVLGHIDEKIAMGGVATIQQLYQDFAEMKREAVSLSYVPAQSGFFGFLYSKVIGKLIISEKGHVGGSTVDSKISRAEFHLQNGNLFGALKELDGVEGLPAEYLKQWRSKAEKRLTMDQNVEILKYHLLNLMEKIN